MIIVLDMVSSTSEKKEICKFTMNVMWCVFIRVPVYAYLKIGMGGI